MEKNDFYNRLKEEKEEVFIRHEKLLTFLKSEKTQQIKPIQHSILKIQLRAMETYLHCLNERIYWLLEENEI